MMIIIITIIIEQPTDIKIQVGIFDSFCCCFVFEIELIWHMGDFQLWNKIGAAYKQSI